MLPAFGLINRMQVGDTGPAESTRQGNLQRVGLLFLGSRDTTLPAILCAGLKDRECEVNHLVVLARIAQQFSTDCPVPKKNR